MGPTSLKRLPPVGAVILACALAAAPATGEEGPPAPELGTDASDQSEAPTTEDPDEAAGSEDGEVEQAGRRRVRKLGSRRLEEGMRGQDVRRLQRKLRGLNFKSRVDGHFGRKTKRQVKRFERWRNMNPNGVVGPDQAQRIKRLYRRGVRYRRHRFPVRGPHSYGGEGSRFGAPRSGHTHQGQDVAAPEGAKLVSVHEGRVTTRAYQEGGAGYYVVIRGKDGTDSVYMHMLGSARVAPGEKVMAGTRIGRVGSTGSSTGPHLHFELWTPHWFAGGHPFDPLPKLLKWDRRS